jgi:hypothetical protein
VEIKVVEINLAIEVDRYRDAATHVAWSKGSRAIDNKWGVKYKVDGWIWQKC